MCWVHGMGNPVSCAFFLFNKKSTSYGNRNLSFLDNFHKNR